MAKDALLKIIAVAGQSGLADMLGVSQQNVWDWANRLAKSPPAEYVLALERISNSMFERGLIDSPVSRYELRPDVFGWSGHDWVGIYLDWMAT